MLSVDYLTTLKEVNQVIQTTNGKRLNQRIEIKLHKKMKKTMKIIAQLDLNRKVTRQVRYF